MPRVLHVINDLAPRGAVTQLRLLAERQETVVATRRVPPAGEPFPAEVIWLGGRFRHDPFATIRLRRTVRTHSPAILQSWDEPSARLCRAARGVGGAHWVHTARGVTGDRRWASLADGVIATDQSVAEKLTGLGPAPRVVANACPPELIAERLPERAEARRQLRAAGVDVGDDSPVIATIAQRHDPVGLEELAWAADLVRAVRPGLRLLVVGEGSARMRGERFAAAACEAGLVVWFGAWRDLGQIYAAADVIWCGRGSRRGSTPVVEADAAGKPVVVAGDPRQENAEDAGLVSPRVLAWNDRAGWARVTHQLLGEPELAAQLGRLGAQRAHTHHDADRIAAAHSAVIDDLLTPAGASG